MTGRHEYRDYRADRRFQPYTSLSPDGTEVAYSDNRSGQFNLVVTPLSGGPDRLITSYRDITVREAVWTPDGRELIYVADRAGDEKYQLYRVAASGGTPRALTGDDTVQHLLGTVSPDGRWLSCTANDREESDQDVLLRDLVGDATIRAYAGGGHVYPGPWAPDSRRLLGIRYTDATSTVVFLLDRDAEPRPVLPPAGMPDGLWEPGPWLPDGSGFLVRTDAGREFVGVARYDVDSGDLRWVLTPDRDVEHVGLSADGRRIVWTVNADGASRMHVARYAEPVRATGSPVPGIPAGPIGALSLDRAGATAAILIATAIRPGNIAVVDLEQGGFRWATDAWARAKGSIEPELVHVAAHDGRRIPAWLYRPAGPGPHPVVLSVHGGPEAQERPGYNYAGLYQYLLANGVGVIAPNVRGSTGYGRTYHRLILRDWGGGDLRDLAAVAGYAGTLSWADPERIGVFGASYGGFAVLSCLSRLPRLFACGVDIVGPANLVTLTASAPPTWRSMTAERIGDPETDAAFLRERSPITYVDQIVAPLFVIQGGRDPRVKRAESDQIVAALRARGVEVRYDVYEEEGHGFTGTVNETRAFGDAADFLITHLRPAAARVPVSDAAGASGAAR